MNEDPVNPVGKIVPPPQHPPMPQSGSSQLAGALPSYLVRCYRKYEGTSFFDFNNAVVGQVGARSVPEVMEKVSKNEVGRIVEGFGKVSDIYFDTIGVQPNNPPLIAA
jgi:hypothetical protein